VPGVGLEHEVRLRNEGGEPVVICERVEAVNGADDDEGWHVDIFGLASGKVAAVEPLIDCVRLGCNY
jgi:hypothetical protein